MRQSEKYALKDPCETRHHIKLHITPQKVCYFSTCLSSTHVWHRVVISGNCCDVMYNIIFSHARTTMDKIEGLCFSLLLLSALRQREGTWHQCSDDDEIQKLILSIIFTCSITYLICMVGVSDKMFVKWVSLEHLLRCPPGRKGHIDVDTSHIV